MTHTTIAKVYSARGFSEGLLGTIVAHGAANPAPYLTRTLAIHWKPRSTNRLAGLWFSDLPPKEPWPEELDTPSFSPTSMQNHCNSAHADMSITAAHEGTSYSSSTDPHGLGLTPRGLAIWAC